MRLNRLANECGGVYTERDRMTRFIRGVRPDIKPLLHSVDYTTGRRLTMKELVENATAIGDSHRALKPKESVEKRMNPRKALQVSFDDKKGKIVPLDMVGEGNSSSDESEDRTRRNLVAHSKSSVMLADEVLYPPTASPSASGSMEATSYQMLEVSQGDVFSVVSNRNPQLSAHAQPTRHQRPGWVSIPDLPNDICFECFALGHKRPNCPHQQRSYKEPEYFAFVQKNFYVLSKEQKDWLANVGRTPAFALLTPRGEKDWSRLRKDQDLHVKARDSERSRGGLPPPPPLTGAQVQASGLDNTPASPGVSKN